MPPDDQPECHYSVLVSRAERRPAVEFWPIRLRDRLPLIPIPLRGPDEDARLDRSSGPFFDVSRWNLRA